ncbi:MAG: DUF3300 domain-containing protein [Ignavibacteriota bacterium]
MKRFRILALLGSSFLLFGAGLIEAQQPPALPPPDQSLNSQQLENLVAPIALYPDPLLTQIMVASTYPLEVVEAYQWLQNNPGQRRQSMAPPPPGSKFASKSWRLPNANCGPSVAGEALEAGRFRSAACRKTDYFYPI